MEISKGMLTHYKIQAAMRSQNFPKDELEYLGERDGEHWYKIAGEHEVPASEIQGFYSEDEEEFYNEP